MTDFPADPVITERRRACAASGGPFRRHHAAIAGATTRIRVQTEVLIAPLHRTALLAKQTATLHAVSSGAHPRHRRLRR